MKVHVCTMHSPAYFEIAAITVPILKEYCERHGYSFSEILVEDEKWAYKKHEYFSEMFKTDIDLIWYVDVDLKITNLQIKIERVLPSSFHLYLTKDFNELNGGSIVTRNSGPGRIMNKHVLFKREHFENEQNVYNSKEFYDLFYGEYCVCNHPAFNSYRYDLYPECYSYIGREDLGDWVEGRSFVLHVPGLSLDKRAEVLRNAKIIR